MNFISKNQTPAKRPFALIAVSHAAGLLFLGLALMSVIPSIPSIELKNAPSFQPGLALTFFALHELTILYRGEDRLPLAFIKTLIFAAAAWLIHYRVWILGGLS